MKPLSILIALVGAGTFLFMSCEGMKVATPPNPAVENATQDGGSGYAPEAGGGDTTTTADPMTFDDAVGM